MVLSAVVCPSATTLPLILNRSNSKGLEIGNTNAICTLHQDLDIEDDNNFIAKIKNGDGNYN
jgi:hypothetical protein